MNTLITFFLAIITFDWKAAWRIFFLNEDLGYQGARWERWAARFAESPTVQGQYRSRLREERRWDALDRVDTTESERLSRRNLV